MPQISSRTTSIIMKCEVPTLFAIELAEDISKVL